jgi:plastocyanin
MRVSAALTAAAALAATAATGCGGGGAAKPPVNQPANPGNADIDQAFGIQRRIRAMDLAIGPEGPAPERLVVRAGTPIRWTNRDDRAHRLRTTGESAQRFSSRVLAPGESFEITAKERGLTVYGSPAADGASAVIDVF